MRFLLDYRVSSVQLKRIVRQTEVAAEMEAIGGRRFFIVDDNFVSQPEQCVSTLSTN